ncbi:predicted protein [Uncinocarpus reesii 1704]|uniref:Major facilitator superfamily (MFS) profile domain-containing protein n=1 Tax=Uncinocarpus reesii (strain UAMH 1704) TaxID=336963 RepID=C4JXV3_UNCRE|nr:uncharacterized protein UREG_07891 [Uncinocarpus reesii 1704]EEP83026.1 predicted protein [Uncinocarpus reesii 1704]
MPDTSDAELSISEPSPITEASEPKARLEASLVVFGSFCTVMAGLGLMNSVGVYQAWISTHQLDTVGEGKIGWIFGVYNFMALFCGIQIGPIFDKRGPRMLTYVGSIMLLLALVLLSFCRRYWHFLLVFGVLGGFATSFIFVVPVACVSHFFDVRRGTATGIAISGASIGGIVLPLVFGSLAPQVGFAWTTRILALISLFLLIPGCIFIRSRLSPKETTKKLILPDFTIFRHFAFAFMTAGVFFLEWGYFVPISYISSYSLAHGIPKQLSYQMVIFMNVGSFPGRWLPGMIADRLGRLNTLIATNVLCIISILAIWLPAKGSIPATIIFSVAFGFTSGSNISLAPVCLGELCDVRHYGRYYSTAYSLASFAALTGVPIAGEIISQSRDYRGLISFAAASYSASLVCFIGSKVLELRNPANRRTEI